jgi:hypothetical protein
VNRGPRFGELPMMAFPPSWHFGPPDPPEQPEDDDAYEDPRAEDAKDAADDAWAATTEEPVNSPTPQEVISAANSAVKIAQQLDRLDAGLADDDTRARIDAIHRDAARSLRILAWACHGTGTRDWGTA